VRQDSESASLASRADSRAPAAGSAPVVADRSVDGCGVRDDLAREELADMGSYRGSELRPLARTGDLAAINPEFAQMATRRNSSRQRGESPRT